MGEDGGERESRQAGAVPYGEIESALNALTTGGGGESAQFRAGQSAAYAWVLGRADSSPVTGRGVRGAPDLPVLLAELDAVTVRLEDTSEVPGGLEYYRGIHAALTWVCGYGTELL